MNTEVTPTSNLPVLSRVLAVMVALAAVGAASASTLSFGGTVEEVGPLNEEAVETPPRQRTKEQAKTIRSFRTRTWYLHYTSDREEQIGKVHRTSVKNLGSVCMLNGELMNAYAFAEALRPGMWGHIYENTWINLYTLPRFEWGEVVAVDQSHRQFTLRKHKTMNKFHLDKNPPVDQTVSYDGAAFELEGAPCEAPDALAVGNWVQVHPPREQLVSVRTKEAEFQPDQMLPYWQGQRGFANDLSAPARLRGFAMDDPQEAYSPSTTLEVTRLRRGNLEDRTFRGSPALFLDGRAAPPSVALRRGRHMVLGHYRGQQSPHNMFLWSDDDTVRGVIASVDHDNGAVTVRLTDRLTGQPTGETTTVSMDEQTRYELNGLTSEADDALKPGRGISVFPRRGRTIRAFRPQHEDKPVFTRGGTVRGRVVGRRERLFDEHRMMRFDLYLGRPLQGPTRVSHRDLYLSVSVLNGTAERVTLHNYADHGPAGKPAWDAEIVEHDIRYQDRKLSGRLVLNLQPGPPGNPSPVKGGRYAFDLNAEVTANKAFGHVDYTLDGDPSGRERVSGRASALPPRDAPLADAAYTLTLTDPQQRVRDLTLHIEAHNGQFTRAVAGSVFAGGYPADVSRLRLEGSRIRGTITAEIPVPHAGLPGGGTLEVTAELDTEATGQHHTGTFTGTWGRVD